MMSLPDQISGRPIGDEDWRDYGELFGNKKYQ